MSTSASLPAYVPILILAAIALGFAVFTIVVSHLLGKPRPNPVKSAPYECGTPVIGTSRYPGRRSALLPALHIAQEQEGHLTPEAIEYVAELFLLTPAQVHDTATYYSMFAFEPRGETHIEICTNLSCALRGADDLLHRACSKLNIEPGGTSEDGRFTVARVECLAACGGAPAVQVNGEWLEGATGQDIDAILAGGARPRTVRSIGQRARARPCCCATCSRRTLRPSTPTGPAVATRSSPIISR